MNKKVSNYICFLVSTLFCIMGTSLGPMVNYIAQEFSLSLSTAGLLFAANSLGFVAFIFPGSILADRLGKKKVIAGSLIGLSCAILLFPLSRHFWITIIITIFIGGFVGLLQSLTNTLITELNKDNANYYVSLAQMFCAIGAFLNPIMVGAIVGTGLSWKICYYIFACISLVTTVLFLFTSQPENENINTIQLKSFKKILSNKKFIGICIILALSTGSEVSSWGWLTTYLKGNMEFTPIKSGVALSIFWIAMIAGRFFTSKLILRYGKENILIYVTGSTAILLILCGLITNSIVIWIIIALLGLSISGHWQLIALCGSDLQKEFKNLVFPILVASGGTGVIVIPYINGIVGQYFGIRVAITTPAFVYFGIMIFFLMRSKGFNEKAMKYRWVRTRKESGYWYKKVLENNGEEL